jgi:hypothetical protein
MANIRQIQGLSGRCEGIPLLRQLLSGDPIAVMPASVQALWHAGAERLVDDPLDCARATAACCAAAKAAVDILRTARKFACRADGVPNIVVADDVAGTDDHGTRGIFRRDNRSILNWTALSKRKNGFLK